MSEAVTDVIVARAREPEGLKPMIVWSAVAHVAVIAALAVAPNAANDEAAPAVMTISLGVAGPETSGMTAIGGREVQAVRPPEPVRRAETAPARKEPEMTLPSPRQRTAPPQRSSTDSRSRTPSVGEEITEGNTRANTRQRSQGFGLSGGGATAGSSVQTDVKDFCCPAYLESMVDVIRRGWSSNQGRIASTTIKFTIVRNGGVQDPRVEIPSGFSDLDSMALRAVQIARLPPLPVEFTNPTLTVHVRFDYLR
jgi:protein TonB